MKTKLTLMLSLLVAALSFSAFSAQPLTKAQWTAQIGACASNVETFKKVLAQVPKTEQAQFVQKVIRAATRKPVSPEEKAKDLTAISIAALSTVRGDVKYASMAEVFAEIPVEYQPVLVDSLSKRFSQKVNGMANSTYSKIVEKAIDTCAVRNAETDEPSVRDMFVVLCFMWGTDSYNLDPEWVNFLTDQLGDSRVAGLVKSWLPAATQGNFSAPLAAADVEAAISLPSAVGRDGNARGDQTVLGVLADLNASANINQAVGGDVPFTPPFQPSNPSVRSDSSNIGAKFDYGESGWHTGLLLSGYQNQGTSI